MTRPWLSVVIPARNEVALIRGTVLSALDAAARLEGGGARGLAQGCDGVEVIVVDNASTDGTAEALEPLVQSHGVRVLRSERLGAPRARNDGAALARGEVLFFLDADTRVPPGAFSRVRELTRAGYEAGLFRLRSQEQGLRAALFWAFWDAARDLPLAKAKAMPAAMFCTRAVFEELGPFDEEVLIGEEWPITAGLWRRRRRALVVDRTVTARSSSRRMELRPFGYSRTFLRYVWAVLSPSGRTTHPDTVRHQGGER